MIRFRLEPAGACSLDFEVLEQDEEQRADHWDLRFLMSNGIWVASVVVPELKVGCVYVRGGHRPRDTDISRCTYNSLEIRDAQQAMILAALREWAGNGGFKNCMQLGGPDSPRQALPPIYEF